MSARNNPDLLKQRVDLFERMKSAGKDEASKMREEAGKLGVTASGFNMAMGKIPGAPPATGTPPTSALTTGFPTTSGSTFGTGELMATRTPPVTAAPPVTGSTLRKAATDAEYEAARQAEYEAAPDYQEPAPKTKSPDALTSLISQIAGPEPFPETKSPDALTAEKLRETARVKESKSPKKTEPTLSDLLAVSDAAVAKYEKSKVDQMKPSSDPTGRTLTGDLKYMREGTVENIDAAEKLAYNVARGGADAAKKGYNAATTATYNYVVREPGEERLLTKAQQDAKNAEELKKSRK
jgi:hypothetical protein